MEPQKLQPVLQAIQINIIKQEGVCLLHQALGGLGTMEGLLSGAGDAFQIGQTLFGGSGGGGQTPLGGSGVGGQAPLDGSGGSGFGGGLGDGGFAGSGYGGTPCGGGGLGP
ncbi:unnamed protein product [Sphagnum jensenii]|uniref:Uncharacterized protein n=1 Tax=Sphagnum jensenii TaxID=128206 RepID=A0ABP0XAU2_9BRYO